MHKHGETKGSNPETKNDDGTPSPPSFSTSPPYQRTWLSEIPVHDVASKLGEQLEKTAHAWFEKQRSYREKKNLKSHTALRYISNFNLLQRNERTCEIQFSIGKTGDHFVVKYKPSWERLERGQFFITSKSKSLKQWADDLNTWNATSAGGEFAYSFQAMEALLLQCEKSYMDMIDLQSNSSRRLSPPTPSSSSSSSSPRSKLAKKKRAEQRGLRQPTSDQFKQVWNVHDADTSHASEAKQRILLEFQKIQELQMDSTQGITVEFVHPNNPFLWRVLLRNFQGPLADDLKSRGIIYNSSPNSDAIELEVKFPAQYPQDPPFLRIKKPILQEFTGRVSGGALCSTTLMKAGWDSSNRMHRVFLMIKEHLMNYEARLIIAAAPESEYPLPTCKASWGYINDRVAAPGRSGNTRGHQYNKDLIILSASFVRECILPESGNRALRGALNDQFEAGNKVIIPMDFYKTLPEDLGSGGMTFQITTPMGLKCFCGILQGLAPEDNQIIVPDWMMRSMFIDDGTKVNFANIGSLNRLIGAVLQPIDSNFKNVFEETGYESKTWLQNALQNYSALTRGQTITLGTKNFDFHEKPHQFTKYNFVLQSIEPDEPGVKMWNDFDMTMNLNFDAPLVDTTGLPSPAPAHNHGSGNSGGGGGNGSGDGSGDGNNERGGETKSTGPKRSLVEIEAEYRQEQEIERLKRLDEKEARERMRQCTGYDDPDDGSSGGSSKIKIWFYRINSKERVLIKAKTTSVVSDLYRIVDSMASRIDQNSSSSSNTTEYHLVDRQERRLPRPIDPQGSTTTFNDLGLVKKNIKIWQKVPQANECDIVLRLASTICKTHKEDLRGLKNATNEKEVRYFLQNTPVIRAMHLSMSGRSDDGGGGGGGGGGGQSESKDNGGGATKNGDGTTTIGGTSGTSSNVSELIEHLIPYIQKAANVKDVAWAPPGGWICQQCDQVNLRVGTFGNERCTKCQTLRRYLMEEILERDTWELSDFLSSKGIRAPNAFPTVRDYANAIIKRCNEIVAPEEENLIRLDETKNSRSEEHRISTVVLPSGKAIGMCQPVIRLSQWYFTMKEIASNIELKTLDVNDLVENLGANIL